MQVSRFNVQNSMANNRPQNQIQKQKSDISFGRISRSLVKELKGCTDLFTSKDTQEAYHFVKNHRLTATVYERINSEGNSTVFAIKSPGLNLLKKRVHEVEEVLYQKNKKVVRGVCRANIYRTNDNWNIGDCFLRIAQTLKRYDKFNSNFDESIVPFKEQMKEINSAIKPLKKKEAEISKKIIKDGRSNPTLDNDSIQEQKKELEQTRKDLKKLINTKSKLNLSNPIDVYSQEYSNFFEDKIKKNTKPRRPNCGVTIR